MSYKENEQNIPLEKCSLIPNIPLEKCGESLNTPLEKCDLISKMPIIC